MPIIKLSATERRRLSVFITCLILAAFAWVLMALSNDYRYTVKQVLTFKNGPQRRAFHSLQSDTVEVTVQGTGWEMLSSRVKPETGSINVDLRTLETKNFVVMSSQLALINKQREAGHWVIAISPDTLYFDFTTRSVKRVPIKLLDRIVYQKRYGLAANIQLKPAYVTISGPAARIANIKEWPTDSLTLININQTLSKRINLHPVNDGSMVIYPKAVEVKVPVDEFTEKTLYLPVKLLNKNYHNVKMFPQKVKVTFLVSLSEYGETDENFFEAAADLNLWKNDGYSTLPVKMTRIPPFCKIVRVEPNNIDFIVNK